MNKEMTETTVRAIAGRGVHVEPGNAAGEWVVAATACWTPGDVLRAIGDRGEERIRTLRREAGEAGDAEQVAICDRALAGEEDALAECAAVILDAAAQG